MSDSTRPRLLTGDRPTGPLHLGHYVGSLETRVALQDSHECFIIVADLHTLTTRPRKDQVGELPKHVRAVVLDLLSVGIDPKQSTIYLQSGVPAVYDLDVLLQMLIPTARLRGLTSVRNMATAAGMNEDSITLGLLAYPVLQAADILMARAQVVPVGKDNEEHVNIARELASVFNDMYGEVFPIPEARISQTPALPGVAAGLGGSHNKMSKSLGNAVFLSDTPDDVARKLRTLDDEGGDGSPLRQFVDAFVRDTSDAASIKAKLDGGEPDAAREAVVEAVQALLGPVRERHDELAREQGMVEEIIVDGTIRAREVAYQTLAQAREAMGLEPLWASLVDATQQRAEARKKPSY